MANDKSRPFLVRIVLLLGMVALLFITVAIYREITKKREVQDKIEQLQKEAEQISRTNALTQDKIAYLESRDYQEREAKDKLNLQSPDEQTVVIKPTIVGKEKSSESESPVVAPQATPKAPNYIKWWNNFFGY